MIHTAQHNIILQLRMSRKWLPINCMTFCLPQSKHSDHSTMHILQTSHHCHLVPRVHSTFTFRLTSLVYSWDHSRLCEVLGRSFKEEPLWIVGVRYFTCQMPFLPPNQVSKHWCKHVMYRDQPNSRQKMSDFTVEFLKCAKFHGKFTEGVWEIHRNYTDPTAVLISRCYVNAN